MTLIYEVKLTINPIKEKEVKHWLKKHIKDMLAIEGFLQATVYQDIEDHLKMRIDYQVDSKNNLERYFANEATAMRAEVFERFGENVVNAIRRVYAEA